MTVILFPRSRDRSFVRRHATNMAGMSPERAAAYLDQQLRTQRQTAEKRGVDRPTIDHWVAELETAIRVELWHRVLTGGAA